MEQNLQLSTGRGPKECCLALQHVFNTLKSECMDKGIRVLVLEQEMTGDLPTSILLKLEGDNLSSIRNRWYGTIQWVCSSPFRPKHPRKNWFVAVQYLDDSPHQVELSELDVEFQTMRSSGAGGQHVNKVSSAVRAIHKPTGLTVQVMDSRSQLQNKQIALQRLKDQLLGEFEKEKSKYRKNNWTELVHIDRGNPTLIFVGEKFKEKI